MRLSMDEVRKQHESTKKLYEQGLRGATANVEQVLDLFDTIEALIAEKDKLIELLKAARSRLPNVMRFCVCGKCKSCGEQIPYTNHIYCDHCLIILIDKVIGGKEG